MTMMNNHSSVNPVTVGLLAIGVLSASGCITSTTQEIRQTDTALAEGESIVVLTRKHVTGSESEAAFVECVSTRAGMGRNAPDVMPQHEFLDSLYPWFETRTAPKDILTMSRVLDEQAVASRIHQIGIRYVVWIDGGTERQQGAGNLQCAMATGGVPACFGMLSWDVKSSYQANVWDVKRGELAGKVSQESSGTSFLPALVIPVPIIAQTRTKACQRLADQIKVFIHQSDS